MGLKKKCREINQAKNKFVEWLKERKAEDIDIYEGNSEPDDGWDYYRLVSAFVGETLYTVYFTMWKDKVKIDYSDEENRYNDMSIEDFMQLLW
jgi:hypothetical protein